MTLPVLTAVADPDVEAGLVAALGGRPQEVRVVRRCVDLADLLAAAAAGLGRAAVVSAQLRQLDREALTRLAVGGIGVVGVTAVGDDAAEQQLRRLGVAHIVTTDSPPDALVAALDASVGTSIPPEAVPAQAAPADESESDSAAPSGTVIAVWGPAGAPGRSTLALNLATELAEAGTSTLLVDADVYGGTIAQLLGLLDEAPGFAAGCRLANTGRLDLSALAGLAVEVRPQLRALTGIPRADRWPELRPSAVEVVLALARELVDVTVVDCGFCLERDEELSFDTAAPRRNGATLTVLAAADMVVSVATADPVGLQRLVRGLGELADAVPGVTPVTVVNRVRSAAVGGGDAESEIRAALLRYAGLRDIRFIPLDTPAYDAAVAAGQALAEAAPTSPARRSIRDLAAQLTGSEVGRPRARMFRRARGKDEKPQRRAAAGRPG
jgi:Flp pilus assembly CpaE family ATPase